MKRLKIVLATLVLFIPPGASAAANTQFTGALNFIGTDFNGAGYIFAINGATSQCASGQFSINSSAPGYKDQVATLMLAWSLGQSVTVTDDNSDSCPNNRANIIGVQIN